MRTRRGVERGSVAIYELREVHPVSEGVLSQERLARAIIKLCARVAGHNHLLGVAQMVGTSMRVGRRIFSIEVNLGFGGGRFHGCVR